jgi:hypothetical protein
MIGLANVPKLSLPGMAGPSDAAPPFNSGTVRGSGRWIAATSEWSGGDHTRSADATSGGKSDASAPIGVAVTLNITSFSGANSTTFTVDGQTVYTNNANQPWSLTERDSNTLQFSVRAGDNWANGGWSDAVNDGGANRSEIQFEPLYAAGTQINVSETLTVQPGPTNTASFLSFNQLHATTGSPPAPFYFGLNTSDHLVVVLQGPNRYYNTVYRSPDPIVRGQPMDLNFQLIMGPSGGGYVGVWLDGTQIVNYHGVVGATGSEYYWKEGIYRGPAAETVTADFSNVQITTGPQAARASGSDTTTRNAPAIPDQPDH